MHIILYLVSCILYLISYFLSLNCIDAENVVPLIAQLLVLGFPAELIQIFRGDGSVGELQDVALEGVDERGALILPHPLQGRVIAQVDMAVDQIAGAVFVCLNIGGGRGDISGSRLSP